VTFARQLCFLLILCAVGLVGCTTPSSRNGAPAPVQPALAAKQSQASEIDPAVMQRYERALRAMKAKRYRQAEKLLLEITQGSPALAGPYVNLGIIYFCDHR
jgi:hypothetical protein